ncbi:hypothetical protein TWF694_010164 [Orbilia ellipsospora]|uniref:Uncharacterized protein n=1 Tax=Orbilia ellipsospora TaxID=2528407 RepID=A0AAV9XAC7_9PEZI
MLSRNYIIFLAFVGTILSVLEGVNCAPHPDGDTYFNLPGRPGVTSGVPLNYDMPPNSACQLGIWQNGDKKGWSWEGYPFGTDPIPSNTTEDSICFNIKDLSPDLPNQVSSYAVTGYCECDFFKYENCLQDGYSFTAFNRADMQLWEHGPDDNTLQSIRCTKRVHKDLLNPTARVTLLPIIALPDVLAPGYYRLDYITADAMDTCRNVFDGQYNQPLHDGVSTVDEGTYLDPSKFRGSLALRVDYCTCEFFKAANCPPREFMGIRGNSDLVINYHKSSDMSFPEWEIMSWRCHFPWGIHQPWQVGIGRPYGPHGV